MAEYQPSSCSEEAQRARGQGAISVFLHDPEAKKAKGLSSENQLSKTTYYLPPVQSPSYGGRTGRVNLVPQRSPSEVGAMGAALPDTRCDPSTIHQGYVPTYVLPHQTGQDVAAAQYFGQYFQPTRPADFGPATYPSGLVGNGNCHNVESPYHQPFQHFQPQQFTRYSNAGPGYYPALQHFGRQAYNTMPGLIFSQELVSPLPTNVVQPMAVSGGPTAGLTGSGPLQTVSTTATLHYTAPPTQSSNLRGPPRKPRQSGYALWCGNLPAQTDIQDVKDHFSREATNEIESVFLISKSNCAFINYKTEDACTTALSRFHDSPFKATKLVCRLRRASMAPAAGTQNGPSVDRPTCPSSPFTTSDDDQSSIATIQEGVEGGRPTPRKVAEKFFVLKSLTVEDLDASVCSGSWATQSHNEAALNGAHKCAENVFLVFSANKSGEYYGYARMASGIDDSINGAASPPPRSTYPTTPTDSSVMIPTLATEHAPKGSVINDPARGTIFWEADREETDEAKDSELASPATDGAELNIDPQTIGRPFKIEWISTEKVPFHRARGLRNPWNQNREVKIARDGTEIEPSVGRRLINLFHSHPLVAATALGGPQQVFHPTHPPMLSMSYGADPRHHGRPY